MNRLAYPFSIKAESLAHISVATVFFRYFLGWGEVGVCEDFVGEADEFPDDRREGDLVGLAGCVHIPKAIVARF